MYMGCFGDGVGTSRLRVVRGRCFAVAAAPASCIERSVSIVDKLRRRRRRRCENSIPTVASAAAAAAVAAAAAAEFVTSSTSST